MNTATPPSAAATPARRLLTWGVFLIGPLILVTGLIVSLGRIAQGSTTWGDVLQQQLILLPPALAFSVVGLIVARKRPANPAGWLMLVIGGFWSLAFLPQDWFGSQWLLERISSSGWVIPFGLMATHLLLRLPDGELLTARWRWVSRLSTLAIALACLIPANDSHPGPAPLAALGFIGFLLLAICAGLSVASLVIRGRRSGADERHQIRWIATGAGVFLAMWLLTLGLGILVGNDQAPVVFIVQDLTLVFYAAIPVSIGAAILRYRLYDIDVVIRKAVVVAAIAVFFVLVYAAVVGGVGALVQSSNNTALSFAAAAVVAVLFQPMLVRARRFADRVVYGKRATPYEVLSEFGDRVSGAYASDEVLPRIARVLAEGVGADHARVWLSSGDEMHLVATWPEDDGAAPREDDQTVEVRHQGELLGALSVAMPPSDPMDPAKEKLVEGLAAEAGLVLRNVRLIEELRASRQRLVAAQDEERRKIERNIHDGVQQQLVALAVQFRLLKQTLGRDPVAGKAMASELQGAATQALDDLRDLARGIYPPLLADKGLPAALEAQARKASIPIRLEQDGVGRYPKDVESSVYFCALEALNNVAKYAEATAARIELHDDDGWLRFRVIDDGRGFDRGQSAHGTGLQGMADRLEAVGGSVTVESAPGRGTTVAGSVPVAAHDAAEDRAPRTGGHDRREPSWAG